MKRNLNFARLTTKELAPFSPTQLRAVAGGGDQSIADSVGLRAPEGGEIGPLTLKGRNAMHDATEMRCSVCGLKQPATKSGVVIASPRWVTPQPESRFAGQSAIADPIVVGTNRRAGVRIAPPGSCTMECISKIRPANGFASRGKRNGCNRGRDVGIEYRFIDCPNRCPIYVCVPGSTLIVDVPMNLK